MSQVPQRHAARPMAPLVCNPPPSMPSKHKQKKSEFFAACQNGTWLEVSKLMETGALLFWTSNDGLSPLHYACYGNNSDVASNLIQAKVRMCTQVLKRRSKYDETPLLMACRLGHATMVDLFVDRSLSSSRMVNKEGETPLHVACAHGNEPVMRRLLLHKNVDVNAKDHSGYTPLHTACLLNDVDLVRTLLENMADVNFKYRNMHDYTPLTVAIINDNWDIVELILYRSEPNLTTRDIIGRTALHLACIYKREQVVTALIAQGAPIDSLDDSHCTPLHYACQGPCPNAVRALLAAGAKTNIKNNSNETPLFLASKKCRAKAVELLLQYGAKD